MRKIFICNSLIDSADKLSFEEKIILVNSISKFRRPTEYKTSLNEENILNGFKSARVNQDIRIIFYEEDDISIICYVAHHDDAYKWAERHHFSINRNGVLYNDINDEIKLDINNKAYEESLYKKAGKTVDDIDKIINNKIIAEYIYSFTNEDNLLDYLNSSDFPINIKESVYYLLININLDKLQKYVINKDKTFIEKIEDDKASSILAEVNDEQFNKIIFGDFERWQIFLHPIQKEIVKLDLNKPILVNGGPGTGKTVVGIHRAAYLLKTKYKDGKILVCSFSKKLAKLMNDKIKDLCNYDQLDSVNIEVDHVGGIIRKKLEELCIDISAHNDNKANADFSFRLNNYNNKKFPDLFYKREYDNVISNYNIKTYEEYLNVDRKGLDIDLSEDDYKHLWDFYKLILEKNIKNNIITHQQLAFMLEEQLEKGAIVKKYDAIIVDEVQDLSAVKVRVLIKLLKEGSNDIMLLSDEDQRIFIINNWQKELGYDYNSIEYKLTFNYRTGKKIFDYAVKNLKDTLVEEHSNQMTSLINGCEPIIFESSSEDEQLEHMIFIIKDLIRGECYESYEICVVANSNDKLNKIQKRLNEYNIFNTWLAEKIYPTKSCGVCLSSSVGIKGLEFRAIIYLGISETIFDTYCDTGIDKRIKYVACTRAREKLYIIKP